MSPDLISIDCKESQNVTASTLMGHGQLPLNGLAAMPGELTLSNTIKRGKYENETLIN